LLPALGGRHRVAVGGLPAGLALDELDRPAAGHVDRGQQGDLAGHQSVPSQLASSTAPASADFSGWNWVAVSGPCSTVATKSSPCVVRPVRGGSRAGRPGGGIAVTA